MSKNNTKHLKSTHPVVLELFTSQGCSSCPPADKLLKEVRSDNVIALSYHVDYWDYIGWKDPFASEKYTNRQRQYGAKFNSSTIYTPQVVVNGREHFVGSDERKLKAKIKQYSGMKSAINIEITETKLGLSNVAFSYEVDGELNDNYLRILLVMDERITQVKRGENRNRTLINNNIVVAEQRFKLENNKGNGRIQIPKIVNEEDAISLVLVVEKYNLDILSGDQKPL